jgi:hypothetical protein
LKLGEVALHLDCISGDLRGRLDKFPNFWVLKFLETQKAGKTSGDLEYDFPFH